MQIAKKLGCTRKGSHLTEKLVVPSRTGIAGAWDIVSQQTGHELVTTHPDKAMDGVHWCPHPDVVQCTRPRQRVEVVRVHQRPVEIEEHASPALVHWHSLRARGRPSRPNSPPPGLYKTRIPSAQRWRRQNPSSRRTRTPWSLAMSPPSWSQDRGPAWSTTSETSSPRLRCDGDPRGLASVRSSRIISRPVAGSLLLAMTRSAVRRDASSGGRRRHSWP